MKTGDEVCIAGERGRITAIRGRAVTIEGATVHKSGHATAWLRTVMVNCIPLDNNFDRFPVVAYNITNG